MEAVEFPVGLPTDPKPGPHVNFLRALITVLQTFLVRVVVRLNGAFPKDGSEALDAYTVATRPTTSPDGAIIYVSDGGAGARFQGRHGGAWVNLG